MGSRSPGGSRFSTTAPSRSPAAPVTAAFHAVAADGLRRRQRIADRRSAIAAQACSPAVVVPHVGQSILVLIPAERQGRLLAGRVFPRLRPCQHIYLLVSAVFLAEEHDRPFMVETVLTRRQRVAVDDERKRHRDLERRRLSHSLGAEKSGSSQQRSFEQAYAWQPSLSMLGGPRRNGGRDIRLSALAVAHGHRGTDVDRALAVRGRIRERTSCRRCSSRSGRRRAPWQSPT